MKDDIKKLWTDEWVEHEGLTITPPKEPVKVKCPDCNGKGHYETEVSGIVYPVDCTLCSSTGKVPKAATYTGVRKG